jgi:hypothetical protein
MQTPTDGPRSGFTRAQVAYLIQNAPVIDTDFGMELLNLDLSVAFDVSDFLVSATVSRSAYANIHGSASFTLAQPLSWGNSIVRPYFLMTGPISSTASALTTMRFNLGAYFTDTPIEDLSQIPSTFDVTGYDILSILDDPIGDAYAVDIGSDPLDAVESILLGRGVTQYQIDRDATAAGRLLSSPMVWTLDDNVSWLTTVNALLAYVGYRGIWSDWNGVLHCETYTSPSDRAPEWTMDANIADTILTQRRKRTHDYYNAPNRWVFYRSSDTETAPPVDGAGRYEFINNTEGETSVEARGGRTITKTGSVDAADQYSLIAAARQTIDADMQIPTTFEIETAPFPLAWHFDVYAVNDPALGAARNVLASQWSFNLDGSDMGQSWQVV